LFEVSITTGDNITADVLCDTITTTIRTIEKHTGVMFCQPVTLHEPRLDDYTTKNGYWWFNLQTVIDEDPRYFEELPWLTGDGLFAGCAVDNTITWPEWPFYPEVAHAQPLPETLGNLHEYVTHINRYTSCRVALTHRPDDTFYL